METENKSEVNQNFTKDEIFESLITDAQYIPGDSKVFEEGREIKWLDMALAQSGQRFFQKHYASLVFAHALYFVVGFGFKPVTGMVIRTGGFYGLAKATKRLLATLWYVLRWYETDIVGRYAKGFKAICKIRKTHDVLRRKCNQGKLEHDFDSEAAEGSPKDIFIEALTKDLAFLDTSTFQRMDLTYDPPEAMSQFSMAMTQISFLLPVFAHPEAFGIYDTEGLEGFEHMWALIGHLSGIDDRFNLPLQRPGREFYIKFWKEVFIPSFLVRDTKIAEIQEIYVQSVRSYIPMFSVPSAFYYYLSRSNIEEFKGQELYKLVGWKDRIAFVLVGITFSLFQISITFKKLMNLIVRFIMQRILIRIGLEEAIDAEEMKRNLPADTDWSKKYRKRDEDVLHKWKKSEALVGMMTNAKTAKKPRKKI